MHRQCAQQLADTRQATHIAGSRCSRVAVRGLVAPVARPSCSQLGSRHGHIMRATVDDEEEEETPFSPFAIKPGFFGGSLANREPDYSDPDWFDKVTDWDEFWNYQRWEMEASQLDQLDEYDNFTSVARDPELKIVEALQTIEARPDVINIVGTETRREHIGVWDEPPVEPETQPELPAWDVSEWRAIAEKQKHKELMDMEWRRRQSKIGKFQYEDPARDVRYRRFDYLNESMDWSHDQIYALITQNGTACRPEDHKGIVENPLVNVDLPNVMGVTHIEDTEEFLERIGHLGVPESVIDLDHELILDLASGALPADLAEEVLEVPLHLMSLVATAEKQEEHKDESNDWLAD